MNIYGARSAPDSTSCVRATLFVQRASTLMITTNPAIPSGSRRPSVSRYSWVTRASRRLSKRHSQDGEPSIVWGAIIARSGTLKSPALDATTAPLRRVQADAMREHQAALKEHAATVLAAKTEKRLPPDPPAARRCLVADSTVEALAPIPEKNPRGVLLARDELSAWLRGFNQYKVGGRGSDAAAWLELHRGGCLIVDRKAADKPTIFVARAAVSVIGTIQPGVIVSVLPGSRQSGRHKRPGHGLRVAIRCGEPKCDSPRSSERRLRRCHPWLTMRASPRPASMTCGGLASPTGLRPSRCKPSWFLPATPQLPQPQSTTLRQRTTSSNLLDRRAARRYK